MWVELLWGSSLVTLSHLYSHGKYIIAINYMCSSKLFQHHIWQDSRTFGIRAASVSKKSLAVAVFVCVNILSSTVWLRILTADNAQELLLKVSVCSVCTDLLVSSFRFCWECLVWLDDGCQIIFLLGISSECVQNQTIPQTDGHQTTAKVASTHSLFSISYCRSDMRKRSL